MDKKAEILILALIVIFLTSLVTFHLATTKAASPRTIIVPDDYTTIQVAVANASPGDNVYVKSGTYNGGILIDKPLSLLGENVDDTIISGGVVLNSLHNSTYGGTIYVPPTPGPNMVNYIPPNIFVVYINSSDVTISGLTIKNGVCISGIGDRLTITGNCGGISLIGNNETITNNISGISITGSSCLVDRNRGYVSVIGSNNVVSNNNVGGTVSLGGGMGIEVTGDSNIIVKNSATNCQIGVMLYCNNSLISDNCIEGNYFMGLCLFQANNNIIRNNYIAYNIGRWDGWGISLSGNPHMHYAANNTIYDNAILGNNHTLRVDPPVSSNFWDSGKVGNYWGDYNGSDINSDGIGDSSYIIDNLNVDHYPLMSPPSISIAIAQGPFYIPPDIGEPYPILSTSTPAPSPVIIAKENNGSAFVVLAISGNVTALQMSNATLAIDQSAITTTISFKVTGESSTTGFSNITIPKSSVFNGTTPKIFIDNQLAQNQGYTQDENYFFAWYTTHFSNHQIFIIFSSPQNSDSSSEPDTLNWIGACFVSLVIAMAVFGLLIYFKKHKR